MQKVVGSSPIIRFFSSFQPAGSSRKLGVGAAEAAPKALLRALAREHHAVREDLSAGGDDREVGREADAGAVASD
jgi:hypothetical protein